MDVIGRFHDVLRFEKLVSHVRINGMSLAEPSYLLFHVGGVGIGLLVCGSAGLSRVASARGVVAFDVSVVLGVVFDGVLEAFPGFCAAGVVFYH